MRQLRSDLQIEVSPDDPRTFKAFQLNNGLRVLLVQLPDARQCAAALAINAGHFQDPDDTPGLSHFLEHMLFLGNQQFPEPDAYSDFISEQGGHHNAWTGTEHTNFYFEVPQAVFGHALERFASLFKQPLFSQTWIDKERRSVEAEYRLKINDELRRLYEVQKETANPDHPFSKFSVGNAATLADTTTSSVKQKLKKYFETWYRAGNMALVLTGPQTTEVLENLASEHFSGLAGGDAPEQRINAPVYLQHQLGARILARPLKQASRLIITFALPSINDDYPHKTTSYIAHILGHESKGSLCDFLREKHWISNLSAGGGMSGSNFKDFNINLQLTDEGLNYVDEIIRACFSYIQIIREQGLRDDLYAERQRMVALSYRYPENLKPVDLASQLSINMLHYQPEHWVSGDYLMQGLNREFAQEVLSCMQPENTRVTLIHRDVPVDRKSTYYNAQYSFEPFTKEQLQEWLIPLPGVKLSLPAPNIYIPERVKPLPLTSTSRFPKVLKPADGVTLWHLQDEEFRVPKAHIYLSFQLPFINASARTYACSRIWCELGLEKLNEAFYDAEVAGIHFNLFPQQSGITLHISGFSDKQPELFTQIIKILSDIGHSERNFMTVRDQLERNWQSIHKNNPINHLFAMLHHQLQHGSYTSKQLADSLEGLDHQHYLNILPGMFRDGQAYLMVHGDIQEETAINLGKITATHLPIEANPTTSVSRAVRRLGTGIEHVDFDSSHPDHALAHFVQGHTTDLEEKSAFLILNQLISPAFFNELRTQKQLGYLVGSSYVPMHGLPGMLFYVQSPQSSPETIAEATQAFISTFMSTIDKIPHETWMSAKRSVLNRLREPDPGLRVRAQRFWTGITNNRADFDLPERLAKVAQSLRRQEFLRIIKSRFTGDAAQMQLRTKKLSGAE